ncbi:MAG: HI0074 family nucleotidyltransferase substrate-binding subunit [Candidatus Binatia bacterium]
MTARREALAAAIVRLRDVLNAPESDVSRDAAIQRFEFCFELAWKSIQERAREEGLECQSPKGCLQLAFKTSWIEDEQGWLAMLQDRNRSSHTYDEDLAKAVFQRLPNYLPLLVALSGKLTP